MQASFFAYLTLFGAVSCEVIGSIFLNKSEQFTQIVPLTLMIVFYLLSFYFLSLTLQSIPLGIAYAMWAGLGIVLTTVVSVLLFDQSLDWSSILGIFLIISGVVIINIFSGVPH